MTNRISTRTLALGLGVLALSALVPVLAGAQGWRTPTGSAQAAIVTNAGGTTVISPASLEAGGISNAEQDIVSLTGLSARAATSVTSGDASIERFGVQSVATAADISILGGRVTALRAIAIATVLEQGAKMVVEGDGTTVTGLVVDGVAYGESLAPNTRIELPGAGYLVVNEQVSRKGRGAGLTVNALHVVLVDAQGATTGEIIVGSASSANGR
jgi:hypothetical protein